MEIKIPATVLSNLKGYEFLVKLNNSIDSNLSNNYILNFEGNDFFEANLCAILGAIITNANSDVNIEIINLKPILLQVLQRNKFMRDFGDDQIIEPRGTNISYKKFSTSESVEFIDYINKELLSKPEFPVISPKLAKKINESIFEVFENARTHGHCNHIFTCGQYFPKHKRKKLDITIVDMGRSIRRNVVDYLKQELKASEAIKWAMQYGNTTKTANISGGLGLDIIKEFVSINKGKLQIVSSNGFLEYSNETIIAMDCQVSFPGTIVNIEFNLDDKLVYMLKEEVSPDVIF